MPFAIFAATLIALVVFVHLFGPTIAARIICSFLFWGAVMLIAGVGLRPSFAAAGGPISLASVMTYATPIIGAILVGAVGAILKLIFSILNLYLAKLGFNLTSDKYSVVVRSAEKIVGGWYAGVEPRIATATFSTGNPTVNALAQLVLDDIGPVATHLGLTQDGAAQFVLWKIGELQKALLGAIAGSPAAAASVPPKPVTK